MIGWLGRISRRLSDAFAGKAGYVRRGVLRRDLAGIAALQKQINLDATFFQRVGLDIDGGNIGSPFVSNPWVYAVLASRARQMAQVPWVIAEKIDNGKGGTRLQPITDEEDPLVKVFKRPNRAMTGEQMWSITNLWLDLVGEVFWVLDRKNVAQEPDRIWPWPGGRLWEPGRMGDDKLPIEWKLTKPNGETEILPTERIVHFRLPNPDNPLRGLPPLLAANTTIRADILSDRYTEEFFSNGAMPSGWIRYKTALDDDEFTEVTVRHEDRHQGPGKRHRIGVLDDGAEFVETGQSNKDMEFLSLKEYAQEVVCATYGWPKWALGITDSMNFATAVAAKQTLWEENLIPGFRAKEVTVDAHLFRFLRGGTVVGFFDETNVPAMRQVRQGKIDSLLKLTDAGMTLKDAAEWLEMDIPRQPGDAEVFKPINLVPVSDILLGPIDFPSVAPAPAAMPDTAPEGAEPSEPEAEPEPENMPPLTPKGLEQITGDDLARLFRDEDCKDAECERTRAERIAQLPDIKQRQQSRRKRQQWRAWNQAVIRPSERQMMRRLVPYFFELAEQQLRQFDRVARANRAPESGRILTRVIGTDDISAVLLDRPEWNSKLRRIMRPIMQAALGLSATFTEGQLGPQSDIDLLDPAIQRFLEARVQLITGVNDRLFGTLARTMQIGINNGETVEEIRGRIEGVLQTRANPNASLRIARTETGALSNTLRFQMGNANLDFWEWVTAADEEVRDSHTNAEIDSTRNPVRVGEAFATFTPMLFPNDPGGPAEETVNCRCTTFFLPRAENPTESGARAMTRSEFLAAFRSGMDAETHRLSPYLTEIEV